MTVAHTIEPAVAAPHEDPPAPAAERAPRRAPRRRRISVTLVLAYAFIALVVAWALFPSLFAPYSAYDPIVAGLQGPSPAHPFGTDQVGRDQLARVIFGARESLLGAAIAVGLGGSVGVVLGSIAGSVGGVVETAVMRIVDVLLAIPGLLLALTVVVLLGTGTTNAALAVGVGAIASFARLVRSEVVQVRRTEYVEAAYLSGGRFFDVLLTHILPNSLRPVLALLALQFGGAILALSTLGFLGYGVTPPDPEWGMIIAQGRDLLGAAWWVAALPGIVLLLVVLSANRISQAWSEAR
ncbi:MAG TPA: ABC transporter permease [Candidatus Microbacterium stercoravium]|uniref:ABC transporter permease n=1 Tax=Candidatus Microbacterium stercoravium TaxID=2838697 RepID=A0A9D2H6E6_9MICO|nr:ABC transporter permease [Candidatus Microbacterium stercoravium]